MTTKARLSVSSWSLHKTLGSPAFYGSGETLPTNTHNQGELSLLELPQAISNFGINTLEITHFHLPSTNNSYLDELKYVIEEANVELFSFLIDDGDITHPEHGERDLTWIESWLDVAAKLGSKCARVIAGKQNSSDDVLNLSAQRLTQLANKAETLGLRLMTENWFATTSTPDAVIHLITKLDGNLGLCLDFGNWEGETKYSNFKQIAHFAESCHTKAYFDNGKLNQEDYESCLKITHDAGFKGPHTLIFESSNLDAWQGLALEKEIVSNYL